MSLNCNIDKVAIDVYDSKVVFANPLPIIFEIETDLAPTNLQPYASYDISAHADSGGYAQITLTLTSANFKCGGYITINSNLYSGTYKILSIISGSVFVIDTPYNSVTTPVTGTVLMYYNNYYIEANVYAGIPDGHFYNLDNPIELITTLRVTPSPENIAYLDVSGAVRSKFLRIENDVCNQVEAGDNYFNDRRAWVAFYIGYREVYDIGATDCLPTQFEGDWETSETYYAINGTTQFQYRFGNNAGEYVLNDNDLVVPTKFLTTLEQPCLWVGKEFDLAFFLPTEVMVSGQTVTLYVTAGTNTYTEVIDLAYGAGVYRALLSDIVLDNFPTATEITVSLYINSYLCSEAKTIKITDNCTQYEGKHITYLNTLGGWDYLFFGAGQETNHGTEETQQAERNIFAQWDSQFVGGTTQLDNIRRKARKAGVLRTTRLAKALQRAYLEQLSATVKIQEIIELSEDVSCLDVANRLTLIPTSTTFAFSDTNKDYTITLAYQNTNETLSQWQ